MSTCINLIIKYKQWNIGQFTWIVPDVKEEYIYLKCWSQAFGMLKGQIEDSPQPLVKIFVLLYKTSVLTHKILEKGSDGYCCEWTTWVFKSSDWTYSILLCYFHSPQFQFQCSVSETLQLNQFWLQQLVLKQNLFWHKSIWIEFLFWVTLEAVVK